MTELRTLTDYRQWIVTIKQRVQASQIKAAVAVNREMLELYWFLGEQILEKQQSAKWGDGFLSQMSKDLLVEFPEIKGFSRRNLFYMRKWVAFWSDAIPIVQQAAAQSLAIATQVAAQLTHGKAQRTRARRWVTRTSIKIPARTRCWFCIRWPAIQNRSRRRRVLYRPAVLSSSIALLRGDRVEGRQVQTRVRRQVNLLRLSGRQPSPLAGRRPNHRHTHL